MRCIMLSDEGSVVDIGMNADRTREGTTKCCTVHQTTPNLGHQKKEIIRNNSRKECSKTTATSVVIYPVNVLTLNDSVTRFHHL